MICDSMKLLLYAEREWYHNEDPIFWGFGLDADLYETDNSQK